MIGVIFNPLCRLGKSLDRFSDFLKKMDDCGLDYVCRETKGPGDATYIATELCETCDTILSVGGDGTLHEVINGVYGKDVKIVVLPYGSGNDLSISLYGKDPDDEDILNILKNGVDKAVDVAVVNDHYILDMTVSYGIFVTIQESYLHNGGTFMKAILRSVVRCVKRRYTIIINGETRIVRTELIAVMNCKSAAGGMLVNRDGDVSDGKMELVIINSKSRIRRLRNFIALLGGRLKEQKNVDTIPFTECRIIPEMTTLCNFDGELLRLPEANIKVSDTKIIFKVSPEGKTNDSILASLKKKTKELERKTKEFEKKVKNKL